jgi:hypothetical protein
MLEALKEAWPLAAVALLYALGWLIQKEDSSFTPRQRLPWDECVHELFSHHRKLVVRVTTAKVPKDMAGLSIAHNGKYSLTLSKRLTTEERKFFSAVTLAKLMDEQSDDSHIMAVDRKLTLNEVRRAEALLAELSLCPPTRIITPLNSILSHLATSIVQIRRNFSWIGIQVKKVVCASFANWSAEACLKRTPSTTMPGGLTAISAVIVVCGLGGLAIAGLTLTSASDLNERGITSYANDQIPLEVEPFIEMSSLMVGLQTAPIREAEVGGRIQKVVPSAAVLYGLNSETWVYTNPEPLVFVRQPIIISHIEGDVGVLLDGPPVGTQVVTVGVAELFGVGAGLDEAWDDK